jgi:hypothetical protein
MSARPAPRPPDGPPLPVFVHRGDARPEVDRLLARLGLSPDDAGLHKQLYVARADQTVVMVRDRDAPLARALREASGWVEPVE